MTRSSPLIDRASELAVGRRALQVAATSVAHVLYVGGPGSGKSALLDALATSEEAEDALVLRAGGTQAETELEFAGLSQLLRPALSDTLDLPVEHQRVLDRVLRVGTPVHRADPPTAMAVLALLDLLSRAQQLVLVIDDL
ncbi:MAG: ATP-binding protein, partial [Gemmatimonadales bacterium]